MRKILLIAACALMLAGQAWGACSVEIVGLSTYANLEDAANAIRNDDEVIITGACSILTSKTIAETGVTVRGSTANPADTVITGGANRWVFTGANPTIKYLTWTGGTDGTNSIMQTNTTGALVEYCIFKDNAKHFYSTNMSGVYRYNYFLGTTTLTDVGGLEAYCSTAGGDFDFYGNVVAPSENYLTGYLRLRGYASFDGDVFQNLFLGARFAHIGVLDSGGAGGSVDIWGNILLGSGAANSTGLSPGSMSISAATIATQVRWNDLLVFREDRHVDDDVTDTENAGGLNQNPLFPAGLLRGGYLTLEVDDTGAYDDSACDPETDCTSTSEFITLLDSYGWNANWNVTVSAIGAAARTAMAEWINAGHEISVHGYSHTVLTTTNCLTLDDDSAEATDITIAVTRTDADDPTTWSTAVSLAGATTASTTLAYGASLADLVAWVESEAGANTEAYDSGTSNAALVSTLDDQTVSINGGTLAFLESALHEVEIGYATELLQAEIRALPNCATCTTYTVDYAASPGTSLNNNSADEAKEAGLIGMRGENTELTALASCHSLDESVKLSPFSIFNINTANMNGNASDENDIPDECADGVLCRERVDGVLGYLVASGDIMSMYLHLNSYSEADAAQLFEWIAAWEPHLVVGSHKDTIQYVRDNGYCIDRGDSAACDESTTGQNESWFLWGPNSTRTLSASTLSALPALSPAMNAGPEAGAVGLTGEQTDLIGNTDTFPGLYNLNIGPDQTKHHVPSITGGKILGGTIIGN